MRRAPRSSGCRSRTRDNRARARGIPPGRHPRLAPVRYPARTPGGDAMRETSEAVDTRLAMGSWAVRLAAVAGAAVIAGGCTWVKPTAGGEGVHVGTPTEIVRCNKLGATHAKTSTKAAFFTRGTKKVD